jgi:hypothetical protein
MGGQFQKKEIFLEMRCHGADRIELARIEFSGRSLLAL